MTYDVIYHVAHDVTEQQVLTSRSHYDQGYPNIFELDTEEKEQKAMSNRGLIDGTPKLTYGDEKVLFLVNSLSPWFKQNVGIIMMNAKTLGIDLVVNLNELTKP